MRQVGDKEQFTPFGLWIREYCKPNMTVSNLDYVFHDYETGKLQLVEEKQSGGRMHNGQRKLFKLLHDIFQSTESIDYWGVYVVKMLPGKTFIGPGVTLNNQPVTVEELAKHLSFERKHCAGWFDDAQP